MKKYEKTLIEIVAQVDGAPRVVWRSMFEDLTEEQIYQHLFDAWNGSTKYSYVTLNVWDNDIVYFTANTQGNKVPRIILQELQELRATANR